MALRAASGPPGRRCSTGPAGATAVPAAGSPPPWSARPGRTASRHQPERAPGIRHRRAWPSRRLPRRGCPPACTPGRPERAGTRRPAAAAATPTRPDIPWPGPDSSRSSMAAAGVAAEMSRQGLDQPYLGRLVFRLDAGTAIWRVSGLRVQPPGPFVGLEDMQRHRVRAARAQPELRVAQQGPADPAAGLRGMHVEPEDVPNAADHLALAHGDVGPARGVSVEQPGEPAGRPVVIEAREHRIGDYSRIRLPPRRHEGLRHGVGVPSDRGPDLGLPGVPLGLLGPRLARTEA